MFFRFLFVCVFCATTTAAAAENNSAFVIHKGINVAAWLANVPRQPLYERDFRQIKRVGFDNIRLPIDPQLWGFSLKAGMQAATHFDFLPIDRAITLATDNGLSIVLDMHPSDAFMKALENDPATEREFINLWTLFAKRYKRYPVDQLAFELVNEPQYYGAQSTYDALIRRLVAAIRREDGKRFIIVGAARGSSIEGLQLLKPFADPYIIYDFHFYEPYIITHQGYHLGFAKEMLRYFHDVPYPSGLVDHDAKYYAPDAPNPSQAQDELTAYTYAGWNARHIHYRIRKVAEWAAENKVRVICGEFGVLRNHIDPTSRYRWIEDTRLALEHNGIGWEIWDYTDGFGIAKLVGQTMTDPVDGSVRFVNAEKGSRVIEPEAIVSLGLKKQ